ISPASAYPNASRSPPKTSQKTFSTKRIASIMRVGGEVQVVDLRPVGQCAGGTQPAYRGGAGRARPAHRVDQRPALTPADGQRRGEGVAGGGGVHRVHDRRGDVHR